MKQGIGYSFFLCYFLIFNVVNPHGFSGDTFVLNKTGNYWQIEHFLDLVNQGQRLYVSSYDESKKEWCHKRVKAAGFSKVICYTHIVFNNSKQSLKCTPLQLFYSLTDNVWVPAYELKQGDRLLCADDREVEIQSVQLVHEALKVYTLEIKHTHTFLVGRDKIVAHNVLIPFQALLGLSIPFDIGCGASAGAAFGPVGICGGVIIGSLVGLVTHCCIKEKVARYDVSFNLQDITKCIEHNNKEGNVKNEDAQAPGKPTENDGFVPKKNWDGKKVRHRRGHGWPDEKGSIWIPSGPNGHGGPHWDVQHPDGSYDNVVPGGRIRGQK